MGYKVLSFEDSHLARERIESYGVQFVRKNRKTSCDFYFTDDLKEVELNIKKKNIDFALIDLNINGEMLGYDAIDICNIYKIPCVVLTGEAEERILNECFKKHVLNIFFKTDMSHKIQNKNPNRKSNYFRKAVESAVSSGLRLFDIKIQEYFEINIFSIVQKATFSSFFSSKSSRPLLLKSHFQEDFDYIIQKICSDLKLKYYKVDLTQKISHAERKRLERGSGDLYICDNIENIHVTKNYNFLDEDANDCMKIIHLSCSPIDMITHQNIDPFFVNSITESSYGIVNISPLGFLGIDNLENWFSTFLEKNIRIIDKKLKLAFFDYFKWKTIPQIKEFVSQNKGALLEDITEESLKNLKFDINIDLFGWDRYSERFFTESMSKYIKNRGIGAVFDRIKAEAILDSIRKLKTTDQVKISEDLQLPIEEISKFINNLKGRYFYGH